LQSFTVAVEILQLIRGIAHCALYKSTYLLTYLLTLEWLLHCKSDCNFFEA